MPDAPLSLFIIYSRTDSAFVDRLEADLKARSFYVWVDRRKIEAGQNFRDELEKAIDRCQILLVVLSPEAMASKYVRQEYGYADGQDKPIIPLNWRTTKVPPTLNGIQWANFQSSYDEGLTELLIALSQIKPPSTSLSPQIPTKVRSQPDLSLADSTITESPLVPPQPAPPLPPPELNELYKEGVVAKAEGNLELAATLWQQVLERDANYENGILAP